MYSVHTPVLPCRLQVKSTAGRFGVPGGPVQGRAIYSRPPASRAICHAAAN